MTTSLNDEPWWVASACFWADEAYRKEHNSFEWWLTFAAETAKMDIDKEKFTGWVSDNYGDDQNRFEASVAWDIYKLGESNG